MNQTPLSVVQGATYSMEVTYADPGLTSNDPPTPKSLAGFSARMSVRSRQKLTGALIFTLDSSNGGGLTIEPLDEMDTVRTGVIAVRISAQLTELLTKATAYYDLFIISDSDPTNAERLVAGTMTVDASVTSVLVAP